MTIGQILCAIGWHRYAEYNEVGIPHPHFEHFEKCLCGARRSWWMDRDGGTWYTTHPPAGVA